MQQAQAAKPAAYTPGQSVLTAKNTLQNIEASKPAAYSPSNTVLQAQRAMQNVEATKPGEYKPSSQVEQYMNAMAMLQANKPGAYQSKYQDQIDSIIQQILNPQGFKYEFNGDNLFKAYSDMYTQKGKQAAEDVQGQAAALTGGPVHPAGPRAEGAGGEVTHPCPHAPSWPLPPPVSLCAPQWQPAWRRALP